MPELSANKGEWSEVYAFLKLLGDGKLYGADAELNRKDDIYYQILNIIRNENNAVSVQTIDGEVKVSLSADSFSEVFGTA